MPAAIIGAVVAGASAWAAAGSVAAVSFFSGAISGWGAIFARMAVSVVVSSLTNAMSKPKKPSSDGLAATASTRSQLINQPVVPRELVYGLVLKSGSVAYSTSTGDNNFLHVVAVIADHEVESLDEVWLDDDVIPNDHLDAGGNVIAGKYAGKVRIKKHLGTADQLADADLVSEVTEWTAEHRGRGVAYLYIRYQADQTLFPNGMPTPQVIVRGWKMLDTRIGSPLWSPNVGLMAQHYLTDIKYGNEVSLDDISQTESEAVYNSCEEIVDTKPEDTVVASIDSATNIITLSGNLLKYLTGDRCRILTTDTAPGGLATLTDYFVIPYQFKGTPRIRLAASLDDAIAGIAIDLTSAGAGTHTIRKTGEGRYFGGGVISTAGNLGDNLKDLLSGMGGRVTNTGGFWKMFAAVWRAPTETLDQSQLRAPVGAITTRISRQSRFNCVKGTYISPLNNWQPSDYPIVKNTAFLEADNGDVLTSDVDMPVTQSASTAQRLAGIRLQLHRQEIVFNFPAKLHGLKFQPVDTVFVDYPRMGWDQKIFEVSTWKFVVENGETAPVMGADMILQETAAECYEWSADNEMTVDPAPNTNFPDPFTVAQLIGLSINSASFATRGGDTYYNIVASWEAVTNAFVNNRGQIQFEIRLTGDPDWRPVQPFPGNAITGVLGSGQLGQSYDIRGRAVNSSGIPGDWVTLEGIAIGSIGGVGATLDWGSVADSVGFSNDYGSVADAVGTTNDWGGLA